MGSTTYVEAEIASQLACWMRALELPASLAETLPWPGERVAVIGCGTSWFIAQSYAAMREAAGQGETDAYAASEGPLERHYDRIVAISRSGTTTEVLRTLQRRADIPSVALTTSATTPVAAAATQSIVLDFADEVSVVQTRFATTVLMLLRFGLGLDVSDALRDVRTALEAPLPAAFLGCEQFTFLGSGWAYGLAQEAALKMREASGAWTEAYPTMEYRHGPISITGPNRLVWTFGATSPALAEDVHRTGGLFENSTLDPMADLVRAQRLAVALARSRGLDPDRPRNLTRSVILDASS